MQNGARSFNWAFLKFTQQKEKYRWIARENQGFSKWRKQSVFGAKRGESPNQFLSMVSKRSMGGEKETDPAIPSGQGVATLKGS